MLSSSCAALPEVSHRLGEANGSFKALDQCWKHCNNSQQCKLSIYTSCILAKLLYGLETLWLLKGDMQRLEAFNVRCLRRICRIPCSFVSHISNEENMRMAGRPPLAHLLEKSQVNFFHKIESSNEDDVLRQLTLCPGSNVPIVWSTARRRGRPKQQWAANVHKFAYPMGVA